MHFGAADDRFVWDSETADVHHRLTLWLHPRENIWLWHLEIANDRAADLSADAILVQDLGLGERGVLMNNTLESRRVLASPRLWASS